MAALPAVINMRILDAHLFGFVHTFCREIKVIPRINLNGMLLIIELNVKRTVLCIHLLTQENETHNVKSHLNL